MADIKKLLAEQKRIEKEFQAVNKRLEAAKRKEMGSLRNTIQKMCREAGTSVEELFGVKAPKAKAVAKPKKKIRRKVELPKYIFEGKPVDGRSARRHDGFNKVKSSGKVDDKKALSAKMINPAWLSGGSYASKKFIDLHKVNVDKY